MRKITGRFRRDFRPWGTALLPEDAKERRRGKILASGWAMWYLFGTDEHGEYLDYYVSHRMTDDRHSRLREDGTGEDLPSVVGMRAVSSHPEEDARLQAGYLEENRRVAQMLEEKGFGVACGRRTRPDRRLPLSEDRGGRLGLGEENPTHGGMAPIRLRRVRLRSGGFGEGRLRLQGVHDHGVLRGVRGALRRPPRDDASLSRRRRLRAWQATMPARRGTPERNWRRGDPCPRCGGAMVEGERLTLWD